MNIQEIISDVESILVHSQEYPFDLHCDNLIAQWYEAKRYYINHFGGATIIRSAKPIKVHLSQEARRRKFNEFLTTLDDNEVLTASFKEFLEVNEQGFFDNKTVDSGAKLSKLFKKYISNPDTVRWAQDLASRYIQENKLEGYLYLSVDPRDFLTMSENNEKWKSCQTLDGDYHVGSLSYMVDNTTLIAYLADEKQQHLRCLPDDMTWNSKKWRMLIHTNNYSCIYYDRQYPYESQELLSAVHVMVQGNLNLYNFEDPQDVGFRIIETPHFQTVIPYNQMNCGGRTFDARDIVDDSDYLGYCDITTSNVYAPVVASEVAHLYHYRNFLVHGYHTAFEEAQEFQNLFGIKVGERPVCPCCGQEYLQDKTSLLCPLCTAEYDADEPYYLYCADCGRHLYDDDEIYWINNEPYCKDCMTIMWEELCQEEEE